MLGAIPVLSLTFVVESAPAILASGQYQHCRRSFGGLVTCLSPKTSKCLVKKKTLFKWPLSVQYFFQFTYFTLNIPD